MRMTCKVVVKPKDIGLKPFRWIKDSIKREYVSLVDVEWNPEFVPFGEGEDLQSVFSHRSKMDREERRVEQTLVEQSDNPHCGVLTKNGWLRHNTKGWADKLNDHPKFADFFKGSRNKSPKFDHESGLITFEMMLVPNSAGCFTHKVFEVLANYSLRSIKITFVDPSFSFDQGLYLDRLEGWMHIVQGEGLPMPYYSFEMSRAGSIGDLNKFWVQIATGKLPAEVAFFPKR